MKKRKYIQPEIELVYLDNQISLQLSSPPSGGGGEPETGNQLVPKTRLELQTEDPYQYEEW